MERELDKKTFAHCRSISILGVRVDHTTYEKSTERIVDLALNGVHGYVCLANVHMVMEGYDDSQFRSVVNSADIVAPDGMPLVWGLSLLGLRGAKRVYGPVLTSVVCEEIEKRGLPVGFYGGSEEVLKLMMSNLKAKFPSLNVAYAFSPPFRALTNDEEAKVIENITTSGIRILFVGLGCPKQETWMAEHKDAIPAVMIGVGAAFDFIAGVKPQSPRWMQHVGLEWLFRLITEPSRLWKRYLYHNPRFMFKFACQLLGIRKYT